MTRIEITDWPDDAGLSLDELCRLAAVSPQWVQWHLEEGLIEIAASELMAARFDAVALARVVDTLLAAIDHISDARQLAGILVATHATDATETTETTDATAPAPDPDPDIYLPCPERGQHTALVVPEEALR